MGSRRQQIGLVMTHAYIMTFIKFVPESSSLEKGAVILIKVRGEGFVILDVYLRAVVSLLCWRN